MAHRDQAQESPKGCRPLQAFNPKSLRDRSHSLLETLADRYDSDGGHGMILPGPLGLRLVWAGGAGVDEDLEAPDMILVAHLFQHLFTSQVVFLSFCLCIRQ